LGVDEVYPHVDGPEDYADLPMRNIPYAVTTYLACRHGREPMEPLAGRLRLLCDPLTGLLAYESFAAQVIDSLEQWLPYGLHLAVGDVDGLKDYVTQSNASDPHLFGHLAGNRCMKIVGAVVRRWCGETSGTQHSILCGTFGGDEVVIAASGGSSSAFEHRLRVLADRLQSEAPRSSSFAFLSLEPRSGRPDDPARDYARWISAIDRALFTVKAANQRVIGQVHKVPEATVRD
jgi:GGDEF domain-containing protein